MQWVKDKINLSEMMIAVGTFGGPIGSVANQQINII